MQFELNGVFQKKAGRGDEMHRSFYSWFLVADLETSYIDGERPQDLKCWSYQQGIALFDIETGICHGYEETRDIRYFVQNLKSFSKAIARAGVGVGIVFIHNISFDLRFFRTMLIEEMQDEVDDFLIDNKHWLYFRCGNLEFRCSYKLTQMNLYTFTKEMHVPHKKLIGANDYGIHYSDEELPKEYHDYMRNDVLGLGESICAFFKIEEIDFTNVPYTSTGFVRNYTKKQFRNDKNEIEVFQKSQPTAYEYLVQMASYSGGQTQVNEKYKDKLVKGKIKHRDFVSFYPSIIYTQMFPYGKGELVDIPEDMIQAQNLLIDMINKDEMIFAEIMIVDYAINKGVMPFLPYIRAYKLTESTSIETYSHKIKYVNGAIMISCSLPELKMIMKYSRFRYMIPLTLYKYKKHRMPQPILNTTKQLFVDKAVNKHRVKQALEEQKLYFQTLLMRAKAKLNAIYGELVEQQLRSEFHIDDEGNVISDPFDFSDYNTINIALNNYYSKAKTGKCFSYAQGCYITSWCRYYLYEFCNSIGWNKVLYVDTDSAFYLTDTDTEKRIDILNAELRKQAEETGAFCEIEGKKDYLHFFDDEEEDIHAFKALNAKRYAYHFTDKKGKEHFTVTSAGVPKGINLYEDETGNAVYAYTREMELAEVDKKEDVLKNLDRAFKNFHNGNKRTAFVFKKCGGTVAQYNHYEPQMINVNGHMEYSEGGVAIKGCWKQMLEPEENEILQTTGEIDDSEICNIFRVNTLQETL